MKTVPSLSSIPTLAALAPLGLALVFLLPPPAVAGVLYKCSGANGQIAYTNKIGNFKNCVKLSSYVDTPAVKTKSAVPEVALTPASATDAPNETGASANPTPAAMPAHVQQGAVYKVARANGITEYTNVRPRAGAFKMLFTYISTCAACDVHSRIDWNRTALNLSAFAPQIAEAASKYGVAPALLRAVIHAESAFDPRALSIKGAQGLMQLMPGTASDLGVGDPWDANENIRGGAQYLAMLLKQFNGDERLAAAAYNAGEGNVSKYKGVPPFDETRVYVDRVATLKQRYEAAQ